MLNFFLILVCLAFSYFNAYEIQASDSQFNLNVINKTSHFNFTKPHFILSPTHLTCEHVWWQISTSPEFSTVISTFDRICPFTDVMTLTELEETFLDNSRAYYFRVKGGNNHVWGDWSETFTFTIAKPQSVENLHMEYGNQVVSKIVWETSDNFDCTYLIFGSNSVDFIPDIYSLEQPYAILDNGLVATSPVNNFIGQTQETYFQIDERFAYYRIIAKWEESLSQPSKILPICDGLSAPERDVLCCLNNSSSAFREKFPEGYLWMQKRVASEKIPSTHYVRNPYVSEELWNSLSPYFLPEHFPEKATLDRIFSQRRVLSSIHSMNKSGFTLITHPKDKIIVAKHPYLKGYLIKAYTDEMEAPDWYWWKKRIDGIRAIQEKIILYGYQGMMKTPQKWIYPLPIEPPPKEGAPYPKNFILVVQEMDILPRTKNLKAYKTKMTSQILDAFYILLTDLLLIDSIYANNTPFCKDGKLAFVDSEHSLDTTRPVPLTTVAKYLSPAMYRYWEQLIVNGGPYR